MRARRLVRTRQTDMRALAWERRLEGALRTSAMRGAGGSEWHLSACAVERSARIALQTDSNVHAGVQAVLRMSRHTCATTARKENPRVRILALDGSASGGRWQCVGAGSPLPF